MFRIEWQLLQTLLSRLSALGRHDVPDTLSTPGPLRSQVEKRRAVDNRVLGTLSVVVDPHTIVSCANKQITLFKGRLPTCTTWP